MKALLCRQPGGPEVLEFVEVNDPRSGRRDVVIDVAATALNHLDAVQRNGWSTMPGFTLSTSPGWMSSAPCRPSVPRSSE